MKLLYRTRNSKEIIRAVFVLFVIGVVAGSIFANVLKEFYFDQIEIFGGEYFNRLSSLTIDYHNLLNFVLWDHYKTFILVWILSATMLFIPYMALSVVFTGASTGFLISIAVMQYGLKGILVFLAYLFPQYIIYVLVGLLTIIQGYRLSIRLYFGIPLNRKGKVKLFVEKIPVIFLLAVLLFAGCAAEAYLNSRILQKVLIMLFN